MRRYFLPGVLELEGGRSVIYPFSYMGRGYFFTPSLADRFFALNFAFLIVFMVMAIVPWTALGKALSLGLSDGLLMAFVFPTFILGYFLCVKWVVRGAEPRCRGHKSSELKSIMSQSSNNSTAVVLVVALTSCLILAYQGWI